MDDPDVALNTPAGWVRREKRRLCVMKIDFSDIFVQHIMAIFQQAVKGSIPDAQGLTAMIIVTSIVAYFGAIASTSRLTWAFGKLFSKLSMPYRII